MSNSNAGYPFFQTKINDLWSHLVLDFNIFMENASICNHFDVEDFSFNLLCLGTRDMDWHDVKTHPIDGIFRARLVN